MDKVVIPRVETAVKAITGSVGHGPNSSVQNPDRRDFTGKTEITPLRSASSRLDLNIEQDEIDDARDIYNTEDANFPATKLDYGRRAHAHHRVQLWKPKIVLFT